MLKALILRKKIDSAKAALEALRAKDAEFEKREAEITRSVEEAADLEEGEVLADRAVSAVNGCFGKGGCVEIRAYIGDCDYTLYHQDYDDHCTDEYIYHDLFELLE